MKKLQSILNRYSDFDASLGGGENRILNDEQREKLRLDLAKIYQTNDRILWIPIGMLTTLFILSIIIVLRNPNNPNVLRGTAMAFGISTAGCIRWLINIWREKTSVQMLIPIAVQLEGDALKTVLMILSRGLRLKPKWLEN